MPRARLVVRFGLVLLAASCSPRRDERPAAPVAASLPAASGSGSLGPIADAPGGLDAPVAIVPVVPVVPVVSIVDAPMAWSAERARLTLAYRRQHVDPTAADLAIEPRAIVLHYTSGGSATGTRGYFDHVTIETSRPELARAGAVNVSAHFVVDRDGTIYRLQPETRFARHCIGLNHLAIGIENVGDDQRWPLTDAQIASNVALVRQLAARFPITHLLGHHEVMTFTNHAYFVERDPTYKNSKPDPGARFMASVRAQLAELGLAGP